MSESNEEQDGAKYLGDVAVRLIESDLNMGRCWRPAVVLTRLLAEFTDFEDCGEEQILYKMQLVSHIVNDLLYTKLQAQMSEEQIEKEVGDFSQWLKDAHGDFDHASTDNNNDEEN